MEKTVGSRPIDSQRNPRILELGLAEGLFTLTLQFTYEKTTASDLFF